MSCESNNAITFVRYAYKGKILPICVSVCRTIAVEIKRCMPQLDRSSSLHIECYCFFSPYHNRLGVIYANTGSNLSH